MGTKVEGNTFLPECHSVIDLTGSTSDGVRYPHYHEGQLGKNGYSGHDIEKVRQTIIEHESIFRNQLQELHRLYGRQRELMSEIRKYVSKDKCLPIVLPPQDTRSLRTVEPRFFTSGILPKGTDKDGILSDNNQVSCHRDTKLSLSSVRGFDFYSKSTNCHPMNIISDDLTLSRGANLCSGFNLAMKDFSQNSLDGMNGKNCPRILGLRNERSGKEHLFEDYVEEGRFDKHYSVKDLFCSRKPLLTEPRSEPSHCPYTGTSVSGKKKKILGVEISGDEYPFSTTSSISIPRQTNHHTVSFNQPSSWVSNFCMTNLDLARKNVNGAKNELHFGNVPYQVTGSDPGKCFKNSDDVNSKPIESQSNYEHPQNGLPWFLKNSQVSSESSKSKKSSYFMNLDSLQNYSEKFFRKAETAEGKFHTLEHNKEIIIGDDSGRRKVEMDDNGQTNEVETKRDLVLHKGINTKCIPNLSRLHIDLNLSLDDEDALAAPSLPTAVVKIAIAEIDFEAPSPIDPEVSYEKCDKIAADAIIDISSFSTKRSLKDEESCDLLNWFADIISSAQNGPPDKVGPVPDSMDDFEFMTLRLEDVKDQHYHEQVVLKSSTSDTLVSKRSRRGRQHRRDFQRDILPGLVTLSRLEVTEDFQAFQELAKTKCGLWSPVRNGRGRKRLGGQDLSPAAKLVLSGRVKRSLTGWGRRTKRLSRQRCESGFIPVKC